MKVTINLNPKKENPSEEVLQNIGTYTPLAGLAAAVVFVIVLLLQVFILVRAQSYNAYTRKWQDWSDEANLLRKAKSEVSLFQAEKQQLQALMVPKYMLALVLDDIFLSLPKNIWFDDLNFKEGSIDLKGYVVRWREDYLISLDKFINALRQKKYFSSRFKKMNITKSQKTDFNGVEVLQFTIECRI